MSLGISKILSNKYFDKLCMHSPSIVRVTNIKYQIPLLKTSKVSKISTKASEGIVE